MRVVNHSLLQRPRAVICKIHKISDTLCRELLYLHRAQTLNGFKEPPGNHLEALKGDRKGQHSIRINDQWRICFKWSNGDVYDVEIVDYH